MSFSPRSRIALVPLSCPACGGALDPLPGDVLYLCASCGAASELAGDSLVRRQVLFAGGGSDPLLIRLPFWRLGEAAVTPAFNGSRLLTLTRWYSRRAEALAGEAAGRPRGLWGGTIGSADAARIFSLAMEEPDMRGKRRRTPVPPGTPARASGVPAGADPAWGVVNEAPPEERGSAGAVAAHPGPAAVSVVAIPFSAEESRFVCALTGLHVYYGTIEAAKEILARWRTPAS